MVIWGGLVSLEKMKCVYCKKTLDKGSKEHIIQNALGGLYESVNICCDECNKIAISQKIDAPFTKIFNPIISRIDNLAKTNNTKSKPSCRGKAKYDGEIYDVIIKNGKVVQCSVLSQKLKCAACDIDFEILSYDFQIDNRAFEAGIKKIAFNFALEKGVPYELLSKSVKVIEKNGIVEDVSFLFSIVPFVALNPMDEYIELETDMELYHNLILFNDGKKLWCYVDLFNTFQYYVLLSEEWDECVHITETYLQLLQKLDRTIPKLFIRKPKHILNYAMFYNIDPCMDLDEFNKRVKTAIEKESLKKNMSDVVSSKLKMDYFQVDKIEGMDRETAREDYVKEMGFYLESLLLYFDQDDKLKDSTFRQVTLIRHNEVTSYPLLIEMLKRDKTIDPQAYINKKIERLNRFLMNFDEVKK